MSANDAVLEDAEVRPTKTWMVWGGRVLTALPVLMMTMSAAMKLSHAPMMAEKFTRTMGYPESTLVGIGLIELFSVVLYAIPRTAILGAIVLTGYLGGAVATHVRIGEPFAVPLLLGILAWAGLYLRDERVRALLPLRNS